MYLLSAGTTIFLTVCTAVYLFILHTPPKNAHSDFFVGFWLGTFTKEFYNSDPLRISTLISAAGIIVMTVLYVSILTVIAINNICMAIAHCLAILSIHILHDTTL